MKNTNTLTEERQVLPKGIVVLMSILLCGLVFGSPSAFAQNSSIVTGIVLDEEGKPIQGASVSARGGEEFSQTVTTSAEGSFELSAAPGTTILISASGYTSQEIRISTERNLRITLSKNTGNPHDPKNTETDIPVSGIVLDDEGNPMLGATITVKDRNDLGGVMADQNGRFNFSVPRGSILLVQFIGYQNREYKITKETQLQVTLYEEATDIEDVVVVGYGVQRKESVVGAISQVHTEELVNSGTVNITNAIAGKLPGVLTYQTSGQPGNNDATIYIRGLSSWNGSEPLILVDGMERSFSELDPNEVRTISVLKDASATAVFGAKGANGVIIVTTRTGSIGRPKMNLSVNYGMDIPTNVPDHISSYQTALMANVAYKNVGMFSSLFSEKELAEYRNPSSRVNSLRYPDNDWFDLLVKKISPTVNANFNISGGNDWVKYFMNFSYAHEGSIAKRFSDWGNSTFRYDKINYRTNLDFTVTKSTSLSLKVGGTLGIRQQPDGVSVSTLFNSIYTASPMSFNAYYPAWALEEIPDTDYPDANEPRLAANRGSYYRNPYTYLNDASFEQTTTNTLYTDLILDQKLDFITEGLSINAKASLSTYYGRISQQANQSYSVFYIDWDRYDNQDGNPWVRNTTTSSVYEEEPYAVTQGGMSGTYYTIFYWEASLNYARTFGQDHHVTGLALFQQRERNTNSNFPYRTQGLVGRVTYAYKNKYLFEANVGYTGSEQFSPSNRYGVFPSAAVGYVISQEGFWKHSMPWWNLMKIRYSDGIVGSDSADERWLYYSSYTSRGGLLYEDDAANSNARWETARKRDLGIEMGWFDNMITLTVDLFDERRKDMLIAPQVTMLVGTDYKNVNRGEMKKHGIDIELGFSRKTRSGLRYDFGAMIGLNENRIVNYEDALYAPDYQKYAGTSYRGARLGTNLVDSGYYTSVDDIHNYPSYTSNWSHIFPGTYKYLDYKFDGKLDSDDLHYIEGCQWPPVVYSFHAGLSYKGFEFNVLFYGNKGKYVEYNRNFEMEFNHNDLVVNKSQLDYWRPDNPNASHNNLFFGDPNALYEWGGGSSANGYDVQIPDRTWRKADYLTLKEIYASYTFNREKLKKALGINSLSIYMTANNVYTFTNLIEHDPQRTSIASGYYPMMTTLKLGIKIGF